MKYNRTVTLKDGRDCVIRNGTEQDAERVLDNFIRTHGQTEFLSTYADETTFTPEQERAFLKQKEDSAREIELIAEIDGTIAGTACVNSYRVAEKTRHRATFGISIDRAFWGIGIGRALTEACIECAKSVGYTQMELGVIAGNERAIGLYRSVGFAEYGRMPKAFMTRSGRWQENVLMLLDLDR